MRAVIYKRVSVLKNSVDGTSLDVQQERLEAYAKAQGWEVTEVYEDPGISAKDTNRPDLQRMLKDAEKGRFDVILVYKLDRLSRSVSDFHRLSNFLDSHRVALVSVTQHLDTSSPTGRLLRNILVDFANFERELITERIVDNKLHRATEGKWNGGHAPFGYKLVNKRPEVVPDEAEKVKQVYSLYLTGRNSMRQIARLTKLSFSQVELILMNPLYSGKIAYGKTKYKNQKGKFERLPQQDWIMADGEHESIITYEEWQRVQTIKLKKKSIPDERNPKQLFKDICYCGECGQKLYFFSGIKDYLYYRCHDINRFEGCKKTVVRQPELEIKTIKKIDELLRDTMFWQQVDANIEEQSSQDTSEAEIKLIQTKIDKLNERIKRLVIQMSDDDVAHLVKPELLKLETERKALNSDKAKIERTDNQVNTSHLSNQIMSDILSNWGYLTFEEKTEGIHILIQSLQCTNEKVKINWRDTNMPAAEFMMDKRHSNGRVAESRY